MQDFVLQSHYLSITKTSLSTYILDKENKMFLPYILYDFQQKYFINLKGYNINMSNKNELLPEFFPFCVWCLGYFRWMTVKTGKTYIMKTNIRKRSLSLHLLVTKIICIESLIELRKIKAKKTINSRPPSVVPFI